MPFILLPSGLLPFTAVLRLFEHNLASIYGYFMATTSLLYFLDREKTYAA